jgi:hypothetical protein
MKPREPMESLEQEGTRTGEHHGTAALIRVAFDHSCAVQTSNETLAATSILAFHYRTWLLRIRR